MVKSSKAQMDYTHWTKSELQVELVKRGLSKLGAKFDLECRLENNDKKNEVETSILPLPGSKEDKGRRAQRHYNQHMNPGFSPTKSPTKSPKKSTRLNIEKKVSTGVSSARATKMPNHHPDNFIPFVRMDENGLKNGSGTLHHSDPENSDQRLTIEMSHEQKLSEAMTKRNSEIEAAQIKHLVEIHRLERERQDELDRLASHVKDDNSKVKALVPPKSFAPRRSQASSLPSGPLYKSSAHLSLESANMNSHLFDFASPASIARVNAFSSIKMEEPEKSTSTSSVSPHIDSPGPAFERASFPTVPTISTVPVLSTKSKTDTKATITVQKPRSNEPTLNHSPTRLMVQTKSDGSTTASVKNARDNESANPRTPTRPVVENKIPPRIQSSDKRFDQIFLPKTTPTRTRNVASAHLLAPKRKTEDPTTTPAKKSRADDPSPSHTPTSLLAKPKVSSRIQSPSRTFTTTSSSAAISETIMPPTSVLTSRKTEEPVTSPVKKSIPASTVLGRTPARTTNEATPKRTPTRPVQTPLRRTPPRPVADPIIEPEEILPQLKHHAFAFISASHISLQAYEIPHIKDMLEQEKFFPLAVRADRTGYFIVFESSYVGDKLAKECVKTFKDWSFRKVKMHMQLVERKLYRLNN